MQRDAQVLLYITVHYIILQLHYNHLVQRDAQVLLAVARHRRALGHLERVGGLLARDLAEQAARDRPLREAVV